jgi:ribosomal protein S18 acetylase RimI-like enzyme
MTADGTDGVDVRPIVAEDEPAAEDLLAALLAGRVQQRLGQSVDVLALEGIGAWTGDRLVGLCMWSGPDGASRSELAALAIAEEHRKRGIAAVLVEAVADAARDTGAEVQWLVTTNDNLDALRLYQRHGYRLAGLRPGSIDEARKAKPLIPTTGAYGIPVRDELILERKL